MRTIASLPAISLARFMADHELCKNDFRTTCLEAPILFGVEFTAGSSETMFASSSLRSFHIGTVKLWAPALICEAITLLGTNTPDCNNAELCITLLTT